MLHLARFAAIAVLVWFYMTAKEKGQPPINWAITGLIGYWITWWAVKLTVVSALSGMVAKNPTGTFLLRANTGSMCNRCGFFNQKEIVGGCC